MQSELLLYLYRADHVFLVSVTPVHVTSYSFYNVPGSWSRSHDVRILKPGTNPHNTTLAQYSSVHRYIKLLVKKILKSWNLSPKSRYLVFYGFQSTKSAKAEATPSRILYGILFQSNRLQYLFLFILSIFILWNHYVNLWHNMHFQVSFHCFLLITLFT